MDQSDSSSPPTSPTTPLQPPTPIDFGPSQRHRPPAFGRSVSALQAGQSISSNNHPALFLRSASGLSGSRQINPKRIYSAPLARRNFIPPHYRRCWWVDEGGSEKDFILVAEFSEIEGPIAVLTIPENILTTKSNTKTKTEEQEKPELYHDTTSNVDIDTFQESEESDSYNSMSNFSASPVPTSKEPMFDLNAFLLRILSVDHTHHTTDHFDIPKDTSVYLTSEDTNPYHAYIHHCTLFDLAARGFVRPLCICYITRDPHKIFRHWSDLGRGIGNVAVAFKRGNYRMFLDECWRRIWDLEYTQRLFIEEGRIEPDFSPVTSNDEDEERDHFDTNTFPTSFSTSFSTSSTGSNNPASSLPGETLTLSAVRYALAHTESIIETINERVAHLEAWGTDLGFFSQDPSEKQDEEEDALMSPFEEEADIQDELTFGKKGSMADIQDLKEMLKKTLEEGKESTSGKVKSIGEWKARKESYKPRRLETLYPTPSFETRLRSLQELCNCPIPSGFSTPGTMYHGPRFYRQALLDLEALLTNLGRDEVALLVEKEDVRIAVPKASAVSIGRSLIMNFRNPMPRRPGATTSFYPGDDVSTKERQSGIVTGGRSLPDEEVHTPTTPTSRSSRSSIHQDWHNIIVPPLNLSDSFHSSTGRHTFIDEEYFPILTAGDQIWAHHEIGLLRVLKRYSKFAKNVVFGLLSGRTVVVQGKENKQKDIEDFVRAFSIFVPGHLRKQHRIIKWWHDEDKIIVDDLEEIKLVGVLKERVDDNVYASNASVVDLDNGGNLITGTLYISGNFLDKMFDDLDSFPTEQAFIAYLHTLFFHLSLKSYLYFHLHLHPGPPDVKPLASPNLSPARRSSVDLPPPSLGRSWGTALMELLKRKSSQESLRDKAMESPAGIRTPPSGTLTPDDGESSKRTWHVGESILATLFDTKETVRSPKLSIPSWLWGTENETHTFNEDNEDTVRPLSSKSAAGREKTSLAGLKWFQNDREKEGTMLTEVMAREFTTSPQEEKEEEEVMYGRMLEDLGVQGDDQAIIMYISSLAS